jgi:hypothetical protein
VPMAMQAQPALPVSLEFLVDRYYSIIHISNYILTVSGQSGSARSNH